MKCTFRATRPTQAGQMVCPTPNRCCALCGAKSCWQRCKDGKKGCQYFINKPDTEEQKQ